MLAACRDIDRRGLEILAVYHSHPTSAPVPSKTDRERNFSEDVLNLIVGLATDPPTVRAWWLTATDHREGELVLVENANG
jgi:proteasome lid subunit RPN8/RPN11